MKALKVGGLLYIQTHQSFPLHGYPNDYFRFSQDALASLFGTTMGFEVVATNYDFPVRLYSRRVTGRAAHAGVPQHHALGREARAHAGRVPLRALDQKRRQVDPPGASTSEEPPPGHRGAPRAKQR